jgi:hypothetical protein
VFERERPNASDIISELDMWWHHIWL